jgi:signal peptidase I
VWGYQKIVTCPECQLVFPVNCSQQIDAQDDRRPVDVMSCTCPNCGSEVHFPSATDPPPNTGDRVIAAKIGYGSLERFQVVVFDFPVTNEKYRSNRERPTAQIRYLDRLIGLPGETIAIHDGKLYVASDLNYEGRPRPDKPEQAWNPEFSYRNDEQAIRHFKQGKFHILRKPPETLLALSRLVYDNDHQAQDLIKAGEPPRWSAEAGWTADDAKQPRRFDSTGGPGGVAWLRYRHLLRGSDKPSLITDFSGYNSGQLRGLPPSNWVGDLMLDCTVNVSKPEGELRLALAKGSDRFEARLALHSGDCTLVQITSKGEKQLDSRPAGLGRPGTARLRFANIDDRLILWVDDRLPFGDGVNYEPSSSEGPIYANDLQPASIGINSAGVSVSKLKLWRDTYYTLGPAGWGAAAEAGVATFYVQPGNYFVLGDNSPESSDSRDWGLVPEPLVLGPAAFFYYPPARAGWVR